MPVSGLVGVREGGEWGREGGKVGEEGLQRIEYDSEIGNGEGAATLGPGTSRWPARLRCH